MQECVTLVKLSLYNAHHHPPQITFASQPTSLGGRCAWALLDGILLYLLYQGQVTVTISQENWILEVAN